MRGEIELPAEAGSARDARRFVVSELNRWGSDIDEGVAALVVSELVTNAVLHARTDVRVVVESRGRIVRISVVDSSPRGVAARSHGVEAATGRGLDLVDALAASWGVEPARNGKKVWAELRA